MSGFRRKQRSGRNGFALLETAMALSILTITGLVLMKLSLNILTPRQYVVNQSLADAYMTLERSAAYRIPLDDLTAADSPWPLYPATSQETVDVGTLPGGRAIQGTVVRFRIPDTDNFPTTAEPNTNGDETSNPAAMRIYQVQSILKYNVGDKEYAKSRTIIRFQ